MAKKDFSQIAKDIIEVCGGESNIISVSHCMTRLRVQLADGEKLDREKGKSINGVLGLIEQNGEYQFVVGQDVPSLYEEIQKKYDVKASGEVQDEAALKQDAAAQKGNVVNAILSFIGGTFSPVIPVLVAGGLTGAVLALLTTFVGISTESGTYTVLSAINQAAFYSLPIFVGFAAATRLKANGYLGAFLGAVLLYSTINGAEGLDFLGIPVTTVAYNSTVFPVILGCLFLSVVYKFLQKHMPVFLRTIVVPLLTMLITVPVTLIVLGPIGGWLGSALASAVYAIYHAAPMVAVAIIGLGTPWLVFFGMNNAMYPIVFALLAEVGSDPLICAGMAPANVAVGGACLAAALIAKDVNDRSLGIGAGLTAFCGITEPGVYGILFTKRYPLIGAMIGGGIGGFIGGLLGMTQYVISTPGFISFAAYINPDGTMNNLVISLMVMVIATVISFVATYILGKKALAK